MFNSLHAADASVTAASTPLTSTMSPMSFASTSIAASAAPFVVVFAAVDLEAPSPPLVVLVFAFEPDRSGGVPVPPSAMHTCLSASLKQHNTTELPCPS